MSEEVDESRRRIVKAAYAAPTLAMLGMMTSVNVSGFSVPCPPTCEGSGQSLEPEPNLEDT
ncbi:MAG: hypothetical protein ACO3KY_13075, partial [Lysobacterales bacterium]